MSWIEVDWKPSRRRLLEFGAACTIVGPCIAWLWGGGWSWMLGWAAVGAVFCLLAWLRPALAAPFYVGAALAAAPIGLVIGELALAAIFFLIVTPLGLAQRLGGRDRLRLETSRDGKTYWRTKRRRSDASSYYRQS